VKGQTLGAAIKLTVFAVVTILATFVLAVTISNQQFGASRTFRAQFTDVTDLLSGDSVRAAGVRVGTVKSVKVVDDHLAQVSFSVDKNVPILTSTHFAVRYLNLVGQRYIALVETNTGSTDRQNPKQVIGTDRTSPALDLTQLFNGFRPLFAALSPNDVNSFALEVIRTLQGEGSTVADLTAKSAELTNTIADRDAAIGGVINNLMTVLDTVAKRDAGLNQTIEQLQRLVSGLAADRSTIASSLQNIDDLASNSAVLLQQIRPYLPSDLTNLGKVANSLNTTKNCPGYAYTTKVPNPGTTPQVPRFANNDCNGPNTLEEFLQRAPTKFIQIIRTATYGSFFNFYLCDLELGGQAGQLPIAPSLTVKQSPACGNGS
jgi:phospholipid/cholesterol/gamma-HCH transport system substrate-binding protein